MRGRRADLAAIPHEAARDDAEFPFNDSIPALRQDAGGVDVTFHRTSPRRFDLVLGADGLHSAVRGLVFGPEADCVRHLGLYVATLPLGQPATDPDTVLLHNRPGRSLAVHPARGNATAAFHLPRPAIPDLDRQDTERHRRVVLEAYRDGGYRLAHRAPADQQPRGVNDRLTDIPRCPSLRGGQLFLRAPTGQLRRRRSTRWERPVSSSPHFSLHTAMTVECNVCCEP